MRRGLLPAACLGLLLVGPGAAGNDKQDPGGCLVVQNGQGVVTVAARGGIFGRFDSGRVTIEDLIPGDTKGPKVFGAQDVRQLTDTKTQYIGTGVRFRFTGGGPFRVSVNAYGIELSVVGRGSAVLSGAGFSDPGTYSVDETSLCAKGFKPLPDRPVRVTVGTGGP